MLTAHHYLAAAIGDGVEVYVRVPPFVMAATRRPAMTGTGTSYPC